MEWLRPEAGGALFLARQAINIDFALSARVRGPLTRDRLEGALGRLCSRHPLMFVRADAREDGTPYLTTDGVPSIPLRIVDRETDDTWVVEATREIQVPAAYRRGPLLRCVWVRGRDVSDLILVCEHLTADGMSAVYALRDLLALAADPSLELEPVVPPPLPDLVPAEVVAQIREDAEAWPLLGPMPPREWLLAEPDEPAHSLGTGGEDDVDPPLIVPFSLEPDELSALLARCRAEGVTVQAALCAAFLTPFAEMDPAQPVRRAEIPADLRPKLTQPVGDAYGNLIGLTIIEFDCTPGRNLWDVARDAARALGKMRDRDIFATVQVVMSLTGHMRNPDWAIEYDLSISNLGRLNIPGTYGDLRLEEVWGPVFPATGPKHLILDVATFAGSMRCLYSSLGRSPHPAMSRGVELLRSMAAGAQG